MNEHDAVMAGVRRRALDLAAERQLAQRRAALGLEIREMRRRRGWTQEGLAIRAGVGRNVVARLEATRTRPDLEVLDRIAVAFGRTLTVTFGRDPLESTLDAGHLAMQELVLRLGRAAGYRVGFELPTRTTDPTRSVDVALRDDAHRRLVLVECWNTIADLGAAARSSDRKRAEAAQLAAAWWGTDPHAVHVLWVVRATARNRALLGRYPEIFEARFPASSGRWVAALERGAPPPADPGLVWSDVPASRFFPWRRAPTKG